MTLRAMMFTFYLGQIQAGTGVYLRFGWVVFSFFFQIRMLMKGNWLKS